MMSAPSTSSTDQKIGRERGHAHKTMKRWILPSVIAAMAALLVWWYYSKDPLRTVPELPVREFLENPAPFVGQTVKAELTVSSELGNSPDKGRLMAFRDEDSGMLIAAIVPPSLDNQIFSKNQKYVLQLDIKKGGSAYVEYLKKL